MTHFLNVDLELRSKQDLGPLLEALEPKVFVLHSRRLRSVHILSLELSEVGRVDADSCIARFAQLVRRLPKPARRLWNRAVQRRFDIGLQAGNQSETFNTLLTNKTLRHMAELSAEVAITVYGPINKRRNARVARTVPRR